MKERLYLLLIAISLSSYGITDQEKTLLQTIFLKDTKSKNQIWVSKFMAQNIFTAYQRSLKYLYDHMHYLNRDMLLQLLNKSLKFHKQKGFITELEFYTLIEVAKVWQLESVFIQELDL